MSEEITQEEYEAYKALPPEPGSKLAVALAELAALRQGDGEIFTCLATGDPALVFDDEQNAEWRQRAELPAGAPDHRALLDQATSLLWDTGLTGNRQAAGELRASGGLEALT